MFSKKYWRTCYADNKEEDGTKLLGYVAKSLISYISNFKIISLFFTTSVCCFFFARVTYHLVDIAAEDPAGFLFYV